MIWTLLAVFAFIYAMIILYFVGWGIWAILKDVSRAADRLLDRLAELRVYGWRQDRN
jgi:hypothetical protein